jgi:hypothetical protein
MSGAFHSRPSLSTLLRAGRVAAVVLALLAFVHVTLPHEHQGSVDERHCPACQVSRHDGVGVPAAEAAPLAPPVAAEAVRVAVPVDRLRTAAHDAAVPARGPPPASPSEPL